jgi:RimK family alpha-L-glutamate ligase
MNIVWILTSEAPDNESIIDRTSLISEGTPGGQYENIRLFDEFKSAGFSVKIINPKKIEINNNLIMCNNEYINKPDIVVLRTTQGINNEILRSLKNLGIKFINDLDAHLTCADKPKQLEILSKFNVDIPKTKIINLPFDDNMLNHITFPIVVKPISSQRGEMVALCRSPEDIYIHCKKIQMRFKNQKRVIFQEFINGPSIAANTIDGSPIWAQIRYPKENIDFLVSNRRDDAIRLPYSINGDLYNLICKATKALNIKIARIDILKLGNQYKICEINSPGGFSGRDQYCDANHAQDIVSYVRSII